MTRFDGRPMSDVLAELAELLGGTWTRDPDGDVSFNLSGGSSTTMAKKTGDKKAAKAAAKETKRVARVQKQIDRVDKKIAKLQAKKVKLETKRDTGKSKPKAAKK